MKSGKAVGCLSLIIVFLILAFFGWLCGTDIEKEADVIKSIQGTWTVQQKDGGMFINVKIEIKDKAYRAWKVVEFTDKSISEWGTPICEGNFFLSRVRTYTNANEKFRHINWSDCSDLHDAHYNEVNGLYWGGWGRFSKE